MSNTHSIALEITSATSNSADDAAIEQFDFTNVLDGLNKYFDTRVTFSMEWRKSQLHAMAKMLRKNEAAIFEALYKDLGKCKQETTLAEIAFLQADIKYALKHIKKWMRPIAKSTPLMAKPGKSFVYPQPLGTVLIIGAWNYPLQLTLSPFVAAIAAGNCAVLKPSEMASNTSALIAKMLPEYLDTKAFKVVEGGKDETTALLQQPFNKIFYTGGERVGKVVMRAASEHLTPVTLELGGKSPCIVDKTADLDITANRIVWGKWLNAGQTCIAPDYVLVEPEIQQAFIEAMKRALEAQYSKEPKSNKAYGRIISQQHCQRVASYLDGQTIIHGGQIDIPERYISPTLVLNPALDSPIMQEEIFGPLLPIITLPSINEMFAFINKRADPLAAYIYTKDKEIESQFIEKVSAGSMLINDSNMFMLNHELPFGGVGASGMGRYHGKYGFDCFSHEKTVMKRTFSFENNIRYAPYTSFKSFLLNRFM
ncbi:aldehyde dehydrogenase family protein [Glaciecola sp. XM2]|jgi:aldehyde dehydrogenase (NAD+)|uniref:aldehyde dehydrogenase family protein n=1 Tax=Glaciecola sp. XM2 TaxID=1914931 RepID=UPI001BDF04E4|nr:aldehyde dehydrogenase family protein [Glaciecola sp. XM2]MBT1452229.1 aldehyde dehydrogenase family protein [Glaciecola sp. XM2]